MRKLIYILITLLIVLTACQPMMHRHHGVSPRTHGHHSEIIGENEAPRENNTPRMHRNHYERMHGSYRSLNDSTGENEIALPPLLEADQIDGKDIYYTIEAQEGETEFFDGIHTKTRGYNGSFLGPVIRVQKDETAHVTLKNNLTEDTTVHWHGLIIEGNADGGPHDVIPKGDEKEITFDVKQDQATLWFHPHPEGHTARQVYEGLAGLLYIEDERATNFEYGVNDFPLVLQDRTFTENGELDYRYAYHPNGVTGTTSLVNGTMNPQLTVPQGKVRLRLLNGANLREYSLTLDDNQTFKQIATDGGLLDEPVSKQKIHLTPSERAEIIVDFSNYEEGDTVNLMNDENTVLLPLVISDKKIDVKKTENFKRDPLYTITDEEMNQDVSKEINLTGMGPHVTINGKKFEPDRIDLTQELGVTEIWEVYNEPNMMGTVHSFHIHGTQFKIISVNGEEPPEELQGYKDTVHLEPGDRVQLAVKFVTPGVYMYHCHILEHEDNGMMGQILVE